MRRDQETAPHVHQSGDGSVEYPEQTDVTEQARITIVRNSPLDVRQRQVVVSIDGETVATLLFGESITREVGPGGHRVRIHNTLVWKTMDIDLAPAEHARFACINRAGFGTYAMLSLLGTGPLYLTVTRDPPQPDGRL